MIITLDGPAGSGKSTAAKLLAKRLGYSFLNTGAMYRAVTLALQNAGISPDDSAGVARTLHSIDIHLEGDHVYLNGHDVSLAIRTPEVEKDVSVVAGLAPVRNAMTGMQREIASRGNYVAEGRDMGSVVFPDSPHKFYIDASPEVRAERRQQELSAKGIPAPDYETLLSEIRRRDAYDSTRQIAPLTVPQGATVVDTSERTIEQVVDLLASTVLKN